MNRVVFLIVLLLPLSMIAQNSPSNIDWANTARYAEENKMIPPPGPHERRIVFMGNSITESWKAFDPQFWGEKGYINRGISGQTSLQMLGRFYQDVIMLKPTVVVILGGTNDIAGNGGPTPLDSTFSHIVSMVKMSKMHGITVVISSLLPALDYPWRPGQEPAEKIIKLNNMLRKYCKENNIVYVDYYSEMVDEKKGLNKKFTADGVHPTLPGFKIMEPIIEKAIAKALE